MMTDFTPSYVCACVLLFQVGICGCVLHILALLTWLRLEHSPFADDVPIYFAKQNVIMSEDFPWISHV